MVDGQVNTPLGVAVFPPDLELPVRTLAQHTAHIVRWTEFDRGGHFAAMEQPELLLGDIRAFFSELSHRGAPVLHTPRVIVLCS